MTYTPTNAEIDSLESEGCLTGELLDRLEAADAEIERLRHELECWRTGVFKPNRNTYDNEPYSFEA